MSFRFASAKPTLYLLRIWLKQGRVGCVSPIFRGETCKTFLCNFHRSVKGGFVFALSKSLLFQTSLCLLRQKIKPNDLPCRLEPLLERLLGNSVVVLRAVSVETSRF